MGAEGAAVGRVIGTEDSTPLEFWVAVEPRCYLQLDDVVATERTTPDGESVQIYGLVQQVRARHEGARFDSDVFLIEDGVLPAEVSEAALVSATRVEPELFVPPLPGAEVRRVSGKAREEALFFDGMVERVAAGLSRDGQPIYVNLEFLDGTRGAHVNISGISGVATKTSYATFLLYSLFTSGVLKGDSLNTKGLIFNVKGEDLMFLDHLNLHLDDDARERYETLGLTAAPFPSVGFFAPPRPDSESATPDVAQRTGGVRSFFWTIEEFCEQQLLPFVFADADNETVQYTLIIHNVADQLRRHATPAGEGGVIIDGTEIRTFRELVEFIRDRVEDDMTRQQWAGQALGMGTVNAFIRRLFGSIRPLERIIRGDIPHATAHSVSTDNQQLTVVDLHNLPDRAKRFVVGVTVKREFERKEASGTPRPLLFLVLDELNKYAPREGWSPIKEILLDVAERGRSLGVILIGAQQTASEVERRIISNSAIRVVGRLDAAEAGRDEYGFLSPSHRQRATIAKPGTMLLSQPEIPIPLVTEFPFPAWATRPSEAGAGSSGRSDGDPFAGLSGSGR